MSHARSSPPQCAVPSKGLLFKLSGDCARMSYAAPPKYAAPQGGQVPEQVMPWAKGLLRCLQPLLLANLLWH